MDRRRARGRPGTPARAAGSAGERAGGAVMVGAFVGVAGQAGRSGRLRHRPAGAPGGPSSFSVLSCSRSRSTISGRRKRAGAAARSTSVQRQGGPVRRRVWHAAAPSSSSCASTSASACASRRLPAVVLAEDLVEERARGLQLAGALRRAGVAAEDQAGHARDLAEAPLRELATSSGWPARRAAGRAVARQSDAGSAARSPGRPPAAAAPTISRP
jgi:hypothetical protein